jgi:hypothetical protein
MMNMTFTPPEVAKDLVCRFGHAARSLMVAVLSREKDQLNVSLWQAGR